MAVRYIEIPPSPVLAAAVSCFWSASGSVDGGVLTNRVLPDGCMDFIFDLSDVPGSVGPGSRSWLVGTMRHAVVVRHTGGVDMIGVRFLPGGVIPFLRVAASELTGLTTELRSFLPDVPLLVEALADATPVARSGDASSRGSEAAAVLAARRRLQARATLIERRLLHRPEVWRVADPVVDAAARIIWSSGGAVTVAHLGRVLAVAPRTLERRFRHAVGISPKAACRVVRLQAAAGLMQSTPAIPLARVAVMAGFHDQAHLTRDFVDLAGTTPAAFVAERTDGFVQDGHAAGE